MTDDPAVVAKNYLKDNSRLSSTLDTKTDAPAEGGDVADGDGKRPKKHGTHRTVNQSVYLGFQEDVKQNTIASVKSVAAGDADVFNGAALLAADDLATSLTTYREAGDDAADLTASVAVSTPRGQVKVIALASSLVPNPSNGERRRVAGRLCIRVRAGGLLEERVSKQVAEQIGALMGDAVDSKPVPVVEEEE